MGHLESLLPELQWGKFKQEKKCARKGTTWRAGLFKPSWDKGLQQTTVSRYWQYFWLPCPAGFEPFNSIGAMQANQLCSKLMLTSWESDFVVIELYMRWHFYRDIMCSVDCVLEQWSSWSSCSKSCSEGFRSRTRNIVQQAEGGLPCEHRHDTQSCNSGQCPGTKTFLETGYRESY